MADLALVTCDDFADLDVDERLVLPALAARGVDVRVVRWTDGLDALGGVGAVVPRSCWDYHERPDAFAAWIDGLRTLDVPVWNPPHVLRWNLDKRHLLELEEAGHRVLSGRRVPAGSGASLADLLADAGWEEAVVKPAVSLGGWETRRVAAPVDAETSAWWSALSATHDLLVQRFAHEVVEEGEWSLVFLAGAFSHAVLKTPGAGEFRVHEEFGGGKRRVDPPLALVETAAAILDDCPGPHLYGRVDGVRPADAPDDFELMEVELLDPSLYLEQAPDAVERWADRLAKLVR